MAAPVAVEDARGRGSPTPDQLVSRILALANDPGFFDLSLNPSDVMEDENASKIGRAINDSGHCLRRLEICGYRDNSYGFQSLFTSWLAHNRSIEQLAMSHLNLSEVDAFQILAPFVEHNLRLRSIEIDCSRSVSKRIPSLISALSHVGGNRLETFTLRRCSIGDERAADLLNALNTMPGLHNLLELDLGFNEIGRKGCVALCALMKNSECRIQTLDFVDNCLDEECMGTLISGLATNTSIRTCNLWSRKIRASAVWNIFLIFLSSPRCSVENTRILGSIGDESASFLGDSLAANMKSLSIGENDFTVAGWREFSNGLRVSSTILLELILEDCSIDDEGAAEVFRALVNNTTLTKLAISFSEDISSNGWVECFRLLIGSQSALAELKFLSNSIDDEGARILADLISKRLSTVRHLDVRYNTLITTDGWRAFTDILLPSSKSKLATLRIGDETLDEQIIDDDVIADYMTALASNKSLTEFDIGHVETISPPTQDALIKVLCDKTSVSSICTSNHTLNTFNCIAKYYPSALVSLLALNKTEDKAKVIREKIFISDVLDMNTVGQVFGPMPVVFFPGVVEWIGRDRLGYSAMYCLVQNIPSLLDRSQPEADCIT